jgi:hypothetical protein
MLKTDERRTGYFQLMQLAYEWGVYIPLYYAPARTAIWDKVKDFQVLPTGNFRLWEVWLDN